MGKYTVDPDSVRRLGSEIDGGAKQIKDAMNHVTRRINDIGGDWTGDAKNAFDSVNADWASTQEKIRAALEDIGTCTTKSGDVFGQAHESVLTCWK